MTIDAPADLVPLVVIFTAILSGLIWLIRAQVQMHKTFQPNGGSSVKDQLNRIEADIMRVRDRVDAHIDWHMDQ